MTEPRAAEVLFGHGQPGEEIKQPQTVATFPELVDLDSVTQQVIEQMRGYGLIFPTRLSDAEVKQFPLDITLVSMVELGEQASYWTAQFARHTAIHGVYLAQKRALRVKVSRLKLVAAKGHPTMKARYEAALSQQARVDAAEALLAELVDSFKSYKEACSREITRRDIEVRAT